MVFWGAEVKPGQPFIHSGEEDGHYEGSKLHLSQATLGLDGKDKERTVVKCKVGDGPELLLCSLTPGVSESCSLDLLFDPDVVFSVTGSTSVHLVGYYMPVDDEEEDDDYPYEGSEFDSECETDDDDDEFDEEDSDLEAPASSVRIEEIQDDEPPTPNLLRIEGKEGTPVKESKKAAKKRKKAEAEGASKKETPRPAKNVEKIVEDESEDEDGFALPSKKKQAINGSDTRPAPSTSSKESKKEKKDKTPSVSEKAGKSADKIPNKAAKENIGVDKIPAKNAAENGTVSSVGSDAKKSNSKKGSPAIRKFPNGLQIEEIAMGKPDARQTKPGKRVSVYYTGKLLNGGKIFDSNAGKKPFSFRLGVGEVIKGWDVGVTGMRIGDKRKITIPPGMGYGAKGVPGTVPGNSWLVFDVEVTDVGK